MVDPAFSGTERFQLVRRLGEGGMGIVYEAVDRERGSRVALKTLRAFSPEALVRFKREFHALQDVSHPNLVALGELIADGHDWFFTMDLVEGTDFVSYVRGETSQGPSPYTETDAVGQAVPPGPPRPYDEARLRDCLRQLADGLEALHAAGKVHRDIKPSNLRITPSGRVVILDFGLVSDQHDNPEATDANVVGTVAYMAPEQAAGHGGAPPADYYSVGALLYEILTGRAPFVGAPLEVLMAKQTQTPPPPSAVVARTPPDLDRLCVELLRFEPERRPRGREVLAALGGAEAPAQPVSQSLGPVFVGRDAELASLRESLAEVSARRAPLVVLVTGESGVGKSALVRRFGEAAAQGHAAVVLAGRCYERESVPYKGIDGTMDALAVHLRRLDRAAAAALLPRYVGALARVFPALRRVEAVLAVPDLSLEVADVQELRARAFAALRELLSRVADRQPLVLAIDDLQWSDADSLTLLAELVRPPEAPALLVVATMREGAALALPPTVQTRPLPVGGLPPAEAERLASILAQRTTGRISEALDVAREAGGHPLFIDELIRHAAHADGADDQPLRLDEALWARAQRLDPPHRGTLELLAVAGTPVPQQVMAEAAGVDLGELGRQVAALRVGNLVRSTGARATDTVEPYHDRVREAVASRLDATRRKQCHDRLARALEASGSADPEVLAVHFRAAGDRDRARSYALEAARAAARALAFDRAVRLFDAAIELGAEPAPGRSGLWCELGEALGNAGRGPRAAEAFERAAAGAKAGDTLELRRRAVEHLLRSGQVDAALGKLPALLGEVGLRMAPSPRRALLSLALGQVRVRLRGLSYHERDDSQIASEVLTRVDLCWSLSVFLGWVESVHGADFATRHLLLALDAGEPRRVARGLAVHACYLAFAGHAGEVRSEALSARAEELALRTRDTYTHAMCVASHAVALGVLGRFDRAHDLATQAEALLGGCHGVAWELGVVRFWRLGMAFRTGRLAELAQVRSLGADAWNRGDMFNVVASETGDPNVAWLVIDEADEAERRCREAMTRWSRASFQIQHWWEAMALVRCDFYRGNPGPALERLRRVHGPLRASLQTRVHLIDVEELDATAAALIACAREEPGRRDAYTREAASLCRKLERKRQPWPLGCARLHQAALAHLEGRREDCVGLLEDAERMFEPIGLLVHLHAARRRRGQVLSGTTGATLVSEADRALAALGARAPASLACILSPDLRDAT